MRIFLFVFALIFSSDVFAMKSADDFCKFALRRFENPSKVLNQFLKLENDHHQTQASVRDKISEMMNHDARGIVFRIEGLARVYERVHGDPFRKIGKKVKKLEDAIGKYDEADSYFVAAQKWNSSAGTIPKDVMTYLRNKREESFTALSELLVQDWIPSNDKQETNVDSILSKVRSVAFGSEKLDRKSILSAIVDELKELEAENFDMRELQTGIHEYRRRLRWFLIYFQGFDGLFQLKDVPAPQPDIPNEYRALQEHPISTDKFSQLPIQNKLKPIYLPRPLFLALSKVVKELGKIKEAGENIEALAHAFHRTGKSKDEAHELAVKIAKNNGQTANAVEEATAVQQEIERTELLKRLRKYLENQQ